MTPTLTPPIFVFSSADVLAFDGVGEAERYLEPVDVRAGEYLAAFDSGGIRLRLEVELLPSPSKVGRLLGVEVEQVRIAFAKDTSEAAPELAERLRRHLAALGETTSELSLPELVSLARTRALSR